MQNKNILATVKNRGCRARNGELECCLVMLSLTVAAILKGITHASRNQRNRSKLSRSINTSKIVARMGEGAHEVLQLQAEEEGA